jgi:hypothetical protein
MKLTEKETHLNLTCDDRSQWQVFTDDPTMIKRFDSLGYQRQKKVGDGYTYSIAADIQFVAMPKKRKPRVTQELDKSLNTKPIKKTRNISDEVRKARSERIESISCKKLLSI